MLDPARTARDEAQERGHRRLGPHLRPPRPPASGRPRQGDGHRASDAKAVANERKHGVSFEQAVAVLEDPLSITFRDPDHSLDESRFLTLGHDHLGVSLWWLTRIVRTPSG